MYGHIPKPLFEKKVLEFIIKNSEKVKNMWYTVYMKNYICAYVKTVCVFVC